MELYIINSVVCLAVLFSFYKLLLENENMHQFKRFYLLGSILASLFIPLITFTTYIDVPLLSEQSLEESTVLIETQYSNFNSFLEIMLWILYGLGVLFYGIKFFREFRGIFKKIKNNPQVPCGNTKNVLLKEEVIPHTFWNYIFVNQLKYEKGQIPDEVFKHEQAHALQRHSIDILLLELFQIFFWFNPLVYLAKRSVKLNHEFLADQAVLQKGINTAAYQKTLLLFSSGNNSSLVNSINYSSIKKRFKVMKTETSKKAILSRMFLVLPLLAVLVYSCSQKEQIENPAVEVIEVVEGFKAEVATPGMVEEYNMRAKHYNSIGVTRENVDDHEFKRLMFLYGKMNPEQRKGAEAFPPPPPPIPGSEKEDIPGPIVIEVREVVN